MCTRFVYRGDDIITGFNFEIDLAVQELANGAKKNAVT